MSKNKNRGKDAFSGVNPQGYSGGGTGDTSPKSKLEQAAKKSHTK
ncbi:small, acid-soluble spore protein L [Jeotgalibacillus marinus]|uniref:Small, acid-soluble spore protein L n=1 Tax=Jeotgalibacillus marinus TaxID=86667 RepID=A0ABV3Q6X0_9BACL